MTVHISSGTTSAVAGVRRALAEMAAGKPVVLIDDHAAVPHGHLVVAGEAVTTSSVAFVVRHSSGLLCAALPGADCDRLDLPPMTGAGNDRSGLAVCVTVDAASGVSTGISAYDRARTVALLADPDSTKRDFTRPGHMIPVRAADGGVLRRQGVAEAAADLARAAGHRPIALFAALDSQKRITELAQGQELSEFADAHGLVAVSISEVLEHWMNVSPLVSRRATADMPLQAGGTRAVGYAGLIDEAEHVALVAGDPRGGEDVPVYVHRECVVGDVFGSVQCDCRYRLDRALATITEEGTGVVVYLRPANAMGPCGSSADRRNADRAQSSVAAHILQDQGVRSVRLLEDDSDHRAALEGRGVPTRVHSSAFEAIS